MIISIGGNLGSGKSTIAKMLAARLGYRHYSTGDFMRQMALDRGITLMELTKQAETNAAIDGELDGRQIRLGKDEDDFVIDSRLGFHFIPQSVKVFLKVSPSTGAQRIMKNLKDKDADLRRQSESADSYKKIYNNMKARRQSEDKRYSALYDLNQSDFSNYDLVIDTNSILPEDVVGRIMDYLKSTGKLQ